MRYLVRQELRYKTAIGIATTENALSPCIQDVW
jgi:hypothetical protein